jgi:hypothetical protein
MEYSTTGIAGGYMTDGTLEFAHQPAQRLFERFYVSVPKFVWQRNITYAAPPRLAVVRVCSQISNLRYALRHRVYLEPPYCDTGSSGQSQISNLKFIYNITSLSADSPYLILRHVIPGG